MSYDEVIVIKSDEMILEAFKRMKDNKIGGLPVVEGATRKIVGNVSIRDIRFLLLQPDLFSSFRHLTVMDFMNTIASLNRNSGREAVIPPITCASNATLGNVIEVLASKAVHRVYIVEGEDCDVVGVVTLRDVISCFIHEPLITLITISGLRLKKCSASNASDIQVG
ncbi:SNF1-related protein kinase regulatory subunit gamma-1-like [Acorus calamus]|nr:SNF1-related protein kinase regulatory subunit gamma-1-like [Acorus calamus]